MKNSHVGTARTGHNCCKTVGQGSIDRKTTKRGLVLDDQYRTATGQKHRTTGTWQSIQDSLYRTTCTGQQVQDNQYWTTIKGQPVQDDQYLTASTRQHVQDSQ